MWAIDTNRLQGYPANKTDTINYKQQKKKAPKTMVSRKDVAELYPQEAKAS